MVSGAKALCLLCPALGMLALAAGCSSGPPAPKQPHRVHTVNIGQTVEPGQINVGRGDEVRWLNQGSQPVAVIFPKPDSILVTCRSGFRTPNAKMLSALIAPNASASLCFAEHGKYNYSIRDNESAGAAQTDRSGTVMIVAGADRSTDTVPPAATSTGQSTGVQPMETPNP
ncbi:hypothetical protein W02_35000 [Nitrospira sp. KM1]|uniref:hypothetical protein n=1 Tax=Nitrospira sp. KM1 TaxID=1936990 RepID=UPI0013A783D1|nr:hypothetical protein [Nitrospira sp. KM1]BCA56360.1 hypothetical protein W02_35000 [Nitrospira sp. KM1]